MRIKVYNGKYLLRGTFRDENKKRGII